MGWDIVFLAQFAVPQTASQRFRRICETLGGRPNFAKLTTFRVLSGSAARLVELGESGKSDGPVTQERVEALLQQYSSDDVAISGTWRVVGERDGVATKTGVIVSAYGPKLREHPRIGRPIDVSWDLGDSRRYTAEGKEDKSNVAQVMATSAIT